MGLLAFGFNSCPALRPKRKHNVVYVYVAHAVVFDPIAKQGAYCRALICSCVHMAVSI